MKIIRSKLFQTDPNIRFGFSSKVGLDRGEPFFFNMSFTVGDVKDQVIENRTAFFNELGLGINEVAYQLQTHSDVISNVSEGGYSGESDALITDKSGLGLAISSADCAAIFIYDKENKVIAGVHSGWKGTTKNILGKTLTTLAEKYNSKPENLIAYIAPSISQKNYEFGSEASDLFDPKYLEKKGDKYLLDVAGKNYDILIDHGISESSIERSQLCSYEEKDLLHSYRRDGVKSGRALGVISMISA